MVVHRIIDRFVAEASINVPDVPAILAAKGEGKHYLPYLFAPALKKLCFCTIEEL